MGQLPLRTRDRERDRDREEEREGDRLCKPGRDYCSQPSSDSPLRSTEEVQRATGEALEQRTEKMRDPGRVRLPSSTMTSSSHSTMNLGSTPQPQRSPSVPHDLYTTSSSGASANAQRKGESASSQPTTEPAKTPENLPIQLIDLLDLAEDGIFGSSSALPPPINVPRPTRLPSLDGMFSPDCRSGLD